jgi:vacuolar-type H+-ATPase subunit E/Vma4
MRDLPAEPGRVALQARSLAALIREQAASEADALLLQAREKAARLIADAEAGAQNVLAAARAVGAARGRRQSAKVLAVAEAEGQRQWLWAREELIRRVLESARLRLQSIPQIDVSGAVAGLLREALEVIPRTAIRVVAPEAYAGFIEEALGHESRQVQVVLQKDFPHIGGVVVETADGRLCFDNSFEARIRRQLNDLRPLIVRILLPNDATAAGASGSGTAAPAVTPDESAAAFDGRGCDERRC